MFVLVAGGFSDEHEIGLGVSPGEDHGLAKALKVFGGGPGVGDGCEGCNFLGGGVSAGCDGGLGRWGRGGRGALLRGSLGGGAAGAATGVELAEDFPRLVIDRDVLDTLLAELVEVVEKSWSCHGKRRS